MENIETLKAFLAVPRKIVLTSHTNPDGDAIGSCLALYHFFASKGHKVSAIVPNEMPDFLSWMPGFSKIFVYDQAALYCTNLVHSAELVFCLDYNDLSRVDKLGDAIASSSARRVLIDHHLFPSDFAEFVLWDTRASSTCELIHDFMVALGEAELAPMDSLTVMYTGILTDTGGFSYATSPKLFRLAADLAERGVDTLGLHDAVFNSYSEKRLRLLAFCLHERLEVVPEFGVAIIGLSQEDHQKFLIRRGDLEGIVNYPLKVRDIGVSVLVAERKTEVKLSFRSKGEMSVQKICHEEFSGGGHRNASGGSSELPLQDTIQKIRDLLPRYFSDLNRPKA